MVKDILTKLVEIQGQNGVLPSYRENKFWFYKRRDTNIFTTASITYILTEQLENLTNEEKQLAEKIINKAQLAFEKYKSESEPFTYNFYPKGKNKHFTNGYLMHRFKHFKLPDDIDDTSLIYLSTKQDPKHLKNKLTKHSTYTNQPNQVYSTWFGKNMPLEQDVCALCNLMVLLSKSNEPLNDNDQATLAYLKKCIENDLHKTSPFKISRHYANTSIILYHYTRLVTQTSYLQELKSQLIKDIKQERASNNPFGILLDNSFIKLKGETLNSTNHSTKPPKNFYPFIGAPLAPLNFSLLKIISSNKTTQIFWQSEAHYLVLLLENKLLNNVTN